MFQRFGNPQAIDRLCNDLGLKPPDRFCQDWEYQVADSKRMHEFVSAYKQNEYGLAEKFLLMRIIVQSLDEILQLGGEIEKSLWEEVTRLLVREKKIHAYTIAYWSLWDEDEGGLGEESWFAITPWMREVSKKVQIIDNCNAP